MNIILNCEQYIILQKDGKNICQNKCGFYICHFDNNICQLNNQSYHYGSILSLLNLKSIQQKPNIFYWDIYLPIHQMFGKYYRITFSSDLEEAKMDCGESLSHS